ncbi:hypothetical protein ACIQ2D_20835 [Lysinibacillus sp. NPDC097287]|uniref:hypothetical protein n=1 Tax=Lysinibacillus sp. NPDC097287 TaxID=3364144 RepID=UPI0038251236
MKALKKSLIIIVSGILGFSLLVGGSFKVLAAGMHGRGPNGFGHHPAIYGPHDVEFPLLGMLLFLIIAVIVLVFIMSWFNKKTKEFSMEQFINTSLASSYRPMENQNEDILDQWEKNINNKENK